MPTGIEGAQRVRGANPPKTKPQAVVPAPDAASRPVWKPKRSGKTAPAESADDDTKGTP